MIDMVCENLSAKIEQLGEQVDGLKSDNKALKKRLNEEFESRASCLTQEQGKFLA